MIYQKNLNSFLRLGYFLNYNNKCISLNDIEIDKEKYTHAHENELIELGAELWRNAISVNFESDQKHLVPLSGGLDSRAILAGLLEFTEAKNIFAYTFGTPNTLDYEIGTLVSKKLGVNHTGFDLTKTRYTQEELEDVSRRVDFQTILFHHIPAWEVDKKFFGYQNWCGFMGDPLAGSKLSKYPSKSLDIAKKKFIKNNTYVSSMDLTNGACFEDLIEIGQRPLSNLTVDEQIDFKNRQLKYIAPHVLMKGYNYKTPFLHTPWMEFILSVDNTLRINQELYKKILLYSFPKEFSYKTKTNAGLALGAPNWLVVFKKVINKAFHYLGLEVNKNMNYLDYDNEIRNNDDLKNIVKNNISDLQKRDLINWVNIEKVLQNHLLEKGNYADALITLVSLEIHMKNGKKI